MIRWSEPIKTLVTYISACTWMWGSREYQYIFYIPFKVIKLPYFYIPFIIIKLPYWSSWHVSCINFWLPYLENHWFVNGFKIYVNVKVNGCRIKRSDHIVYLEAYTSILNRIQWQESKHNITVVLVITFSYWLSNCRIVHQIGVLVIK